MPTGKRIEITERDVAIFRLLARYRYLSSTYIHAFVGGASATRFKERLGDLFHEGYIDRPERQWEFADCRHRPVIHEFGRGARHVLEEHGIVEEGRTWLSASAHRQYFHSLMICEILASIELGVLACPGLRFVSWAEILAKAPESTRTASFPARMPIGAGSGSYVVPDAVFGLEYLCDGRKTYRFFALEADRGTMPIARSSGTQTSYLAKLAAYREMIARNVPKTYLGLPNLLVLTVTVGSSRLQEMSDQFLAKGGSSPVFLFKHVGCIQLPALDLLRQPWLRIGTESLHIDAAA